MGLGWATAAVSVLLSHQYFIIFLLSLLVIVFVVWVYWRLDLFNDFLHLRAIACGWNAKLCILVRKLGLDQVMGHSWLGEDQC